MKTYIDKVIAAWKKGSTYTCYWCFKSFQGRYRGTTYAYQMAFCSSVCELQFKTDDIDPNKEA